MSLDSSADLEEQLRRTARATVGDELRSVVYFTESDTEKVYLREDLDWGDHVGFAETERAGFRSQLVYDESELGEYVATIRMFDGGYLTRVIVEDHGAFVTTDRMDVERFEELASAVHDLLEETA